MGMLIFLGCSAYEAPTWLTASSDIVQNINSIQAYRQVYFQAQYVFLSLSLFHAISQQRIFSIRDVATYDAQGTPLFTVRQAINLFHCVSAQMLTHTHKAQTNTHTHDVYKMLKYEPRRSHSVYSFNFGSIDKHYGGDAAWFFAFSFLSHFFNRNNRSNELYTHSKHSP